MVHLATWTARGFNATTIESDSGVSARVLDLLARPAWVVTAADIDQMVGTLAAEGRRSSTRRGYVQVFKGSTGSCKPARLPKSGSPD